MSALGEVDRGPVRPLRGAAGAGAGAIEAPVGQARAFAPELVMIADPQGLRAEAVRALRTHIVAQHVDEGRRAVAVCAASSGVGCTFVAANLAVSLAQTGLKTLLIDANLREPGLETILGPRRAVGLQQCLQSPELGFGDCIEGEVVPNLSVMCAGGISPVAQELLAGDRFKALMEYCLRDFDFTIVDTPPANTCSDARRVSTVVRYSLVVARRDHSFIADVQALIRQLADDHAKVVGTVLNEP